MNLQCFNEQIVCKLIHWNLIVNCKLAIENYLFRVLLSESQKRIGPAYVLRERNGDILLQRLELRIIDKLVGIDADF